MWRTERAPSAAWPRSRRRNETGDSDAGAQLHTQAQSAPPARGSAATWKPESASELILIRVFSYVNDEDRNLIPSGTKASSLLSGCARKPWRSVLPRSCAATSSSAPRELPEVSPQLIAHTPKDRHPLLLRTNPRRRRIFKTVMQPLSASRLPRKEHRPRLARVVANRQN